MQLEMPLVFSLVEMNRFIEENNKKRNRDGKKKEIGKEKSKNRRKDKKREEDPKVTGLDNPAERGGNRFRQEENLYQGGCRSRGGAEGGGG